jgi:hypothetical protein
MIKVTQDWPATTRAEPDLHDFDMFIRPEELETSLQRTGLEIRDRVGFAAANPPAALKAMWDRAHRKITYRDVGERLRVKESRDTSSSYGGYALKARRPADREPPEPRNHAPPSTIPSGRSGRRLEAESGAGRDHRRLARVDGGDDLGVVDPCR